MVGQFAPLMRLLIFLVACRLGLALSNIWSATNLIYFKLFEVSFLVAFQQAYREQQVNESCLSKKVPFSFDFSYT